MINEDIKELISSLDQSIPWVAGLTQLASNSLVEFSSNRPGHAMAKEVLADAQIHKRTTTMAGIETSGFDELIERMKSVEPNETIMIAGLIGPEKRGIMYYTAEGTVLGGVVITRRESHRGMAY